ncbi:MAG TPA: ABC transporter permease [Acidimicrobiia bacterium]|nr:ABC transporter permease [Acidimicrobiia bacterium]
MRTWRTIWLIAVRELRERAASRAFQVSTGMTVLLVVGLLLAPTLFGLDDPPSYTIGVDAEAATGIDEAVALGAPTEGTSVELEGFEDIADLRQAVQDGEVDIGVSGSTILVGPQTGPELRTLTIAAVAALDLQVRAADLGLDNNDLAQLLGAAPEVVELESDTEDDSGNVVAFVGTILLFISIVTYGQWILIGVVEEKTSRVVEVVLGTVRARHLLAGKVIGIGILGLAQLLLIGVLGVYIVRTTEQFDVPSVGVEIIAIVVGWFLLGFTFYATGYAVAGSLVSRQEDAQNASFPLTILMLAAYFVAIASLESGDNIAIRIMSLVPPFSPLTMPLRQAAGDAAVWEVAFSVLLMIGAIVLMLRIGGRAYSGGLLRSGGKVKLREAFRSAEG